MKKSTLLRFGFTALCLGSLISTLDLHAQKNRLIFSDDFNRGFDSSMWIAEIDPLPESKVLVSGGKLMMDTRAGVTVWLKKLLKGNIEITFTRRVAMKGGPNDRLSDLNQFWMATDPRNANLFTRTGKFEEYDSLRMYYVGFGGNTNTTTRFRKYLGTGERLLLQEHVAKDYLLQSNKDYLVRIVVRDNAIQFFVGDTCFFSYTDPEPLKEGYFGFRSTWSRQEIDDFKVRRLD